MLKTRVIPCLLLRGQGLVKTVKFKDPKYVGDPINAVKIFNDKEVDELIFMDITATIEKRGPNFKMISEIAAECFMPFGYGGGISHIDEVRRIINVGAEKVILNTAAHLNPNLIEEAAAQFGSQSIVVAIDIKKSIFGKAEVFIESGQKKVRISPVDLAKRVEQLGAGEIIVNSIDRDGTGEGYDIDLLNKISSSVHIPIVASGGAGKLADFREAKTRGGASAVAAGSMFVFHGKHRAVLITYPEYAELEASLN
ncbi:AglZ/HisF2 family acetamidino modification protein [Pontibacter sp. E15-1]|uniref:AglZ/HisF2 family acetamidino modification protein n=1 Tax=Pontibacter sp. E15-1 TaxID=2919918 RepID=UPI001F4FD8F6|nr:AglZ/HisF2 family acetamidino modification protein [Pontibacter sp. E15-1]MCJ8166405.1 AglZ/HisF2 family acetamidino modification protein [Pontibacter sp. E15-1]